MCIVQQLLLFDSDFGTTKTFSNVFWTTFEGVFFFPACCRVGLVMMASRLGVSAVWRDVYTGLDDAAPPTDEFGFDFPIESASSMYGSFLFNNVIFGDVLPLVTLLRGVCNLSAPESTRYLCEIVFLTSWSCFATSPWLCVPVFSITFGVLSLLDDNAVVMRARHPKLPYKRRYSMSMRRKVY